MSQDNPLDRYLHSKGHYPTAVLGKGKFSRTVWVTPGYIGIEERLHRVYIPRNDLVKLLKWLVPLVQHMDESQDPRRLVEDVLAAEEQWLKEFRRQKKARRPSGRLRYHS